MAEEYGAFDREVVDYHLYELDPQITDRESRRPLMLRGPAPPKLVPGQFLVCLGAAQTFGRFCEKPYPVLLHERLGVEVINFGRGGAGALFFVQDNPRLFEYVNNSAGVIVQVMSGRSESNSLYRSNGLGSYTRVSDGSSIGCDAAFTELIANHTVEYVRSVVAETRRNWIEHYRELLAAIRMPKVLFWFSIRAPTYEEDYTEVYRLFGAFPQLVNAQMVEEIRKYADGYVETVSRRGLPQRLVSRFTGQHTTVTDAWGGVWAENWYYPSPEMHGEAAAALEASCRQILRHDLPEPWWKRLFGRGNLGR